MIRVYQLPPSSPCSANSPASSLSNLAVSSSEQLSRGHSLPHGRNGRRTGSGQSAHSAQERRNRHAQAPDRHGHPRRARKGAEDTRRPAGIRPRQADQHQADQGQEAAAEPQAARGKVPERDAPGQGCRDPAGEHVRLPRGRGRAGADVQGPAGRDCGQCRRRDGQEALRAQAGPAGALPVRLLTQRTRAAARWAEGPCRDDGLAGRKAGL